MSTRLYIPKPIPVKPEILAYKEAPSGYILTTKWEPPYVMASGHGYQGVLAQDSLEKTLQCHLCGQWFKNLPPHISQSHGVRAAEYKRQFGLSQATALSIIEIRSKQSETMKKLNKLNPAATSGFTRGNIHAGNRKGHKKSAEWENKYGICEKQIMDKVLKLADKMGTTPSLIDMTMEYGSTVSYHIRRKFQSYISLCRRLKLIPVYSSRNPKYSRQYFINKIMEAPIEMPIKDILSSNEDRAMYRYFKGGAKELKEKASMEDLEQLKLQLEKL